ncbi:hypothetical protein [Pseudoalteromonas sp. XMcav11-Q]|uniref:guanylate kinase n=1 Tax=Pseudoalteromonas sp. XMcav11-Q TaxID=3136665 RepID=UPI0032C45AF7
MLLTISGPSTIGKDSTWLNVAKRLGMEQVVPYTTREKRDNETDGISHRFISVSEFQQKIKNNELLEWDYILGNYYGTDLKYRSLIESGSPLVVDILARMAIRLKNKVSNVKTVLLLTSDSHTLQERLIKRGYEGVELIQRTSHGFEEEAHSALFDMVIPDADIVTETQALKVISQLIYSSE